MKPRPRRECPYEEYDEDNHGCNPSDECVHASSIKFGHGGGSRRRR